MIPTPNTWNGIIENYFLHNPSNLPLMKEDAISRNYPKSKHTASSQTSAVWKWCRGITALLYCQFVDFFFLSVKLCDLIAMSKVERAHSFRVHVDPLRHSTFQNCAYFEPAESMQDIGRMCGLVWMSSLHHCIVIDIWRCEEFGISATLMAILLLSWEWLQQIGRASCRERV